MADKFPPGSEDNNSLSNASKKKSIGAGKISANKYDIDPNRPLHNFEHSYAEAYECVNTETGQNDHVAIVIKDRYPVRKDIVDKCLGHDTESLMQLRTTVVIDWPDNTQRYVIIFKRPEGHPIFSSHAQKREPLSEETMRRGIIRPITHTLRTLNAMGLFHGSIRPTNIFMTNHESAQCILGECASSAAGINQPLLYETIERGMADRESRGVGTEYDDIYSFGATVAVLLRGYSPVEGKSDRAIIEDKINRGSYAVFTDGLRLSPGLSEFLRATLNDEPRQRWDMTQLVAFVDGNRTTPKQSIGGSKAQRHLDFNGKKYIRPRMLAKDLQENPSEALLLIESGNLAKWIERALGDQAMLSVLNTAIGRASAAGRTTGFEERLLSYVSMALDPQAPIRYKNIKVFPSGIGQGLAFAMLKNENVQPYGELIRERYPWNWLNHKENEPEEHQDLLHLFDQASKMIIRRGIDYGIERCLYELSPDIPCLSDYFKDYYVSDSETLLVVLDKIYKNHKDQKPLDRHIASFITVRDNRDNSGLMMLLEGTDPIKRSLALITIYQQMQRRFSVLKLPNLCEWLVKEAEIAVQRFRSISLKQEILKQLPKEVSSGNITRLLVLIDNPAQVKKDENDFVRGMRQYYTFGHERDNIRKELTTNPNYGFKFGRRVALFVSMSIAILIVVVTLIIQFGDNVK